MNKLYTALVRPRYHQFRYAVAILVGYTVGGFYLSSCDVGAATWGLICLLVGYTAITGMGGVVLSAACFSTMVIVYAFTHPWPITKAMPIPLTPPQIWSSTLITLWLLGSLLIILLGAGVKEFARQQRFPWKYTAFLGGLSYLALALGHRFHLTITT